MNGEAGPPALGNFIRRLPKTETHLHIEGALPYELLRTLDPGRFTGDPPFWAPDYRYETFEQFEGILLDHAILWFTSAERYHEAARVIFEGLLAQNVRYLETSFHLGIVEFTGIPGPEIIRAIKSAVPPGMVVRVFTGMLRRNYTEVMAPVIDELHTWEELDGIDLHGVEVWELEPWTPPVWKRLREAGKETKAHAGEFGGPENVREALDLLGVRRIQHGVRAAEDEDLLRRLADEGVVLDICPISNVKLRVVPGLDRHPIRTFLERGIRCTVSTDDPFSFGNRLEDEYLGLAREAGFDHHLLARVARNGFEAGTMPAELRRSCLAEIDALERAADEGR
ncbi:MAG: adenosine deaminase family protein [Puniceicoccaceae bacterium]|nr:MAG: adenosine deaminase family protein [Puniceicoccaceae bacterium]